MQIDDYFLRVTLNRNTGTIDNILIESQYLGQTVIEIFTGQIAQTIHKLILTRKLSKAIGLYDKLDFSRFSRQGMSFKTSELSN